MYPHLGKSWTAYAKSVKSVHAHYGAQPDPGVLFDSISFRDATEISLACSQILQTASEQGQQYAFLSRHNYYPRCAVWLLLLT